MNSLLHGVSWPSGALPQAVRVLANVAPIPYGQLTLQRAQGAIGVTPDTNLTHRLNCALLAGRSGQSTKSVYENAWRGRARLLPNCPVVSVPLSLRLGRSLALPCQAFSYAL